MAQCPKCQRKTTVWNRDALSGVCSRCRNKVPAVRLRWGSLFAIFVILHFAIWNSSSRVLPATASQVHNLRDDVTSLKHRIRKLQSSVDKLLESD